MKHLVRIIIWTVIVVCLLVFVLLRIPAVQLVLADNISEALEDKLGTKVEVGRIDLRLFNRIIIDDLAIYDQQKKVMLRAGRASVTVELMPLLDGTVSISSAQLFGMKANIYRKNASSPLNCQFFIDSLKSKDTTSTATLDLSIASLIIRNGSVSYNQWDKPSVNGRFSPNHINVTQLSSHIILYRLTNDSINFALKRLTLNEASGINISNLTTDVQATQGNIFVSDTRLTMPHTNINIPEFTVTYTKKDSTIRTGSLRLKGQIKADRLTATDFSPLLRNENIASIPAISINAAVEGTDKSAVATLSARSINNTDLAIQAAANVYDLLENPRIDVLLSKCVITENSTNAIVSTLGLPKEIGKIGTIDIKGRFRLLDNKHFTANTDITASKVGKVTINGEYDTGNIKSTINTTVLDLTQLTNTQPLSGIKCELAITARTDGKWNITSGKAKGVVSELTYKDYTYRNINADVAYDHNIISGLVNIQDPNIKLTIDGRANIGPRKSLQANAIISDFRPSALNITNQFAGDCFALSMSTDAGGSNIDNLSGSIRLHDISITNPDSTKTDAYLKEIVLSVTNDKTGKKAMNLNSDCADVSIHGNFAVSTIINSFTNLITTHLPAITSLPKRTHNTNDFRFEATVKKLDFIKRLVRLPITINSPLTAKGFINSSTNNADVSLSAPTLDVFGTKTTDTGIRIWTEENAINSYVSTKIKDKNGAVSVILDCKGADNTLYTQFSWDNMRANIFRGRLNGITQFTPNITGSSDIQVNIPHSTFEIGDTIWNIRSHGINYKNNSLTINHLAIENESQHLYVSGIASKSPSDTITAELKDINISYILNLINFHSVSFDGLASGHATCSGAFLRPAANAALCIEGFKFEEGRLGTMRVKAEYNDEEGQINIDGNAEDGHSNLLVKGNISPTHNTIDLGMELQDTRLEFMQSFCGSFMHDIAMNGTGHLRLHGSLNAINLEGNVEAGGAFTLTSTGCRYAMEKGSITFVPNDIRFNTVPITDKSGGVAYLTGGVHHRNLGRISYDITAKTKRFIAYDRPIPDAEDTFCGHIVIDGEIGIHGKGNEVNITADCTPLKDSYFTYNASSPETIRSQDFITWGSMETKSIHGNTTAEKELGKKRSETDNLLDAGNDRANIRLNFMANMTPEARLHIIMDETTGDYVDLFGTGTLRIQFYNKGSLDIFGNYAIDHGTYKMTIQNLMRRDFAFQKGGVIAFAGDPYNATLNLQAAYLLSSVSLADLNIGSSFKSNNVPVNCLMNITGTPEKPKVDFGLNLPSLSSDARQMVYSVINSEEEMNQQVLYLLAIGRFYSQTDNEENIQRTKQSTLAMQSFLSGTLSQQLNNVLGQVTGNTNWSLGANITPGADGFNNAVYEGLLSGRMFNNRLIFNGQFGYRDNINTDTQNFIGDFTLQYLLTPNGNFSLKMYNQSNDRYFTRSSLNTQGIGVVIQKEFGK